MGTPTEKLTLKSRMRLYTLSPSSQGPGRTSLAPTIGAEKTVPQPLAWNMGTMARIVVELASDLRGGGAGRGACDLLDSVRPFAAAYHTASACPHQQSGCTRTIACRKLLLCEYSTPLGLPVVPEV